MDYGLVRFAFFHLAFAAFAATFERWALVMVLRRRFPPIWPPRRPMAAMYSEIFAGDAAWIPLGISGSGSGIWPVETAIVQAANWFGSRGRLPLPTAMVIAPRYGEDDTG